MESYVFTFIQTGRDGDDDEENVTKHPLTGIPQIDYVWDPNLPRELNGYDHHFE